MGSIGLISKPIMYLMAARVFGSLKHVDIGASVVGFQHVITHVTV